MKNILGLDLGTNSIGWALIQHDEKQLQGKILGIGSRIIPMSQDILSDFGKGNSISQTAERTKFRSVRRLRERHLLRRQRLHRVLNVLGFLPSHFASQIDFNKNLGQFFPDTEPKLAYDSGKFIFLSSFTEMLGEFRKHQPGILVNSKGEDLLVPYDWTIYYLRKKALTKKISKEELAWIILNFNQKRGYYQLRGEEEVEDNPKKKVELHTLKIMDVVADPPQKGKSDIWYSMHLENGWIYRRSSKTPLDNWLHKTRDFIVTTDLNDDGTEKLDKEGNVKRSFKAPGEDDWTLVKTKTQNEIIASEKTVGAYIFDELLSNPKQKIRGKFVRTIEREFYKSELTEILSAQEKFHPEFLDSSLLNSCIRELYRNNESHQFLLSKKNLKYLLTEDIIFYQRPLKSKKSSIANCTLEYRTYKDKDGEEMVAPLKAAPKSHPLFQEFRLWQWVHNLKIIRNDDDQNMNDLYLGTMDQLESLFDFLTTKKEIKEDALLKFVLQVKDLKGKSLKEELAKYRWNYVSDKAYPCYDTRALIKSGLNKVEGVPKNFLTPENEFHLWHILYSVRDIEEYEKALTTFATKKQLDVASFVKSFKTSPPFNKEYGAYSTKAIKRLLPLMRLGKSWSADQLDARTKERIGKIITGEYDASIKDRVREKAMRLQEIRDFQGLPLWLTSYIVYDRHAEAANAAVWKNIGDLIIFIKEFRQHSLRNPIVEQVLLESLRVVKDIWKEYGKGQPRFFDEVHLELGREMKNNAEKRKQLSAFVARNEATNLRIKAILTELAQDSTVENVRAYSPSQQEIFKIFEEGVLSAESDIPDDVDKISRKPDPSSAEIQRYKLWLEQRYRSPYTGQVIPLSRLFTPAYEIEHVIPQSRYFNNSFNNKVICEAAVNKEKGNQTGMEFIQNHHGATIETGGGRSVRVFEVDAYTEFIKQHYAKSRNKREILMQEDIPEKMIERQLNDTRYISKYISSILSNLVRSENDDTGVNSKNLIPVNGAITNELKHDWGLHDVWNDLILPRFERMNQITNSTGYTKYNKRHQKYLPTVPLEHAKGFQKKRIDHRHHAMDALVIACASRSHVNYLNNKSALDKKKSKSDRQRSRDDLRHVLCNKTYGDDNGHYSWTFKKPWENFTKEAREHLERIIVSFKQNLRVINKSSNKSLRWVDKDGRKVKKAVKQSKGDNWAIRKPLHKETFYGKLKLRKIKVVSLSTALNDYSAIVDKGLRRHIGGMFDKGDNKAKISKFFKAQNYHWNDLNVAKVEVYYWLENLSASRTALDESFDRKRIEEKVTDSGIQRILLNHLKQYEGKLDTKGKVIPAHQLAFSPEGIEEMNNKIVTLNNGKPHQPIYKVRAYKSMDKKFAVGYAGNKKTKYVKAAEGTNLFFGVYQNEYGKRDFETIPLNIVIERLKQGLGEVPETNDKGLPLAFHLSPNDLVYVPTEDEQFDNSSLSLKALSTEQFNRVYKMVSSSSKQCMFVQQTVAVSIVKGGEFTRQNKMERSIEGTMIKSTCLKLKVNRLGHLV